MAVKRWLTSKRKTNIGMSYLIFVEHVAVAAVPHFTPPPTLCLLLMLPTHTY